MNNYCVYFLLLDTDKSLFNRIFYVGITKNPSLRKDNHKKDKINPIKHSMMDKYGWEFKVIWENLSEEEAKEREIFIIRYFGRKDLKTGQLANMTDGGDSSPNSKFSIDEIINHIRKSIYFPSLTSYCKQNNLNLRTFSGWRRGLGISKKQRKYSPKIILKFKKSGLLIQEFAARYNLSRYTLSKWIKRFEDENDWQYSDDY